MQGLKSVAMGMHTASAMTGVLQEVCEGERKRIIEAVSKQKSLDMGICPKVALVRNESLAGQKSLLAVLFVCGRHGLCAGRGLQGHL